MTNPDNATKALRTQLKQRRQAIDPADRYRGALLIRGRLFTWLATACSALRDAGRAEPHTIAAFWPLPEEPELQPLLRQWVQEEGYRVCLPVVTGPGQPLSFRLWTPDTPMQEGAFGIQEPAGEPVDAPQVVLVPTLGYTRQGDRLGYGQGYYDRTLAQWRSQGHRFVAIGIGWATGDLSGEAYTPAPHDQPLDAILTDKGWAKPAPDALETLG